MTVTYACSVPTRTIAAKLFSKGMTNMIDRVFWSQVNVAWSKDNDEVFADKEKVRGSEKARKLSEAFMDFNLE